MKISYDSFHGLKRHFVGGLSEPSRFWLERAEGVHLGFSGEGVSEAVAGAVLHFGPVPALGEHRRIVWVENYGQEFIQLSLNNTSSWLKAAWQSRAAAPRLAGGESAGLELTFRDVVAEERALACVLLFTAETESGDESTVELGVRLTTFLKGRFSSCRFQGSAEALPHDFGRIDPEADGELAPYLVAIDSLGSERLHVVFEDLPAWLAAEVDGYPRYGPAPGKFFERQAPVRLHLRPVRHRSFLGSQRGSVTLRTDDARPEWHQVVLELSARFERERSFVTATAVEPMVLVAPESLPLQIQFVNWGLLPARLEIESKSSGLEVGPLPEVPGAAGAEPGRQVLHATIASEALAPDTKAIRLTVRIVNGDPAILVISVSVVVVRIDPGVLNFDTVRSGEQRIRSIRVQASDGRPLHLGVRLLPEAEGLLQAKSAGDVLEVVCRPPAGTGPLSFEGPGIEVSEESLGLKRQITVKLHVPASFFSRLFGSARNGVRA